MSTTHDTPFRGKKQNIIVEAVEFTIEVGQELEADGKNPMPGFVARLLIGRPIEYADKIIKTVYAYSDLSEADAIIRLYIVIKRAFGSRSKAQKYTVQTQHAYAKIQKK